MKAYVLALIDLVLMIIVFVPVNYLFQKPLFASSGQIAFSLGFLALIKIYQIKDKNEI